MVFIVLGPGNGQWTVSLAVGRTSYQHFYLMDVGGNRERGSPYADEALEVKMLVKLFQASGPRAASLSK